MGVITRSNHPSALWPGVNAHFGQSYNEHPLQYKKVFKMETSKKHYEEDVENTSFGLAPIKPEGSAVQYDFDKEGYTQRYRHAVISLGFVVTREEMEDNQYYEKAKKRSSQLAFSMRQTKEIIHANHFNRGFDANSPIGTGKSMLALDHPTLSGAQRNTLLVPADLSEPALEDMLIDIRQMRNSRGLKIAVKGQCLIVPDNLTFTAERIIKTNLRVGTDLNDVNAIKSQGLLPMGIHTWTYLTDNDAWFVKTDVPHGLKTFQRRALEFKRDNDFDTDNAKAKSSERYSCGISDFRGVFGSPGA